jgi:PAS domain S-box-containing protein
MSKKPIHEELEQCVKELKKKALQIEQAEAAVRESEERYRRITEAVTDYVFSVRVDNGYTVETVHGPGCVAVTGYSPEDFASDPYLWIQMVHEEDQGVVQEQAERMLLGQDVQPIEHRIWRKDSIIRWVRNTLVPQYNQEGDLLSYDGLVRDIHDRKQAEEELQKAHDELELCVEKRTAELVEANKDLQHEMKERKRLEKALMQREKLKTLGAVASEVAHEIRNPLVSIGGFAKRLKQKFPDSLECDIILTESQRLEGILSRIRSYLEPIEIHPQECSVNTIIAECLNLLSPEMEQRQVTGQLDLAPGLQNACTDPEILAQIFINLIRNITEAMDEGGTLLVKTFESDQDLHIEFKNQSPGLKIEDSETLFMPFAEGSQSMGIPLCYRLLKDMGGLLYFTQEKDYMVLTVSLSKKIEYPLKKEIPDGVGLDLVRDWASVHS